MAYGLFAARHHLHPQRGAALRLRSPGDLDGTAQSGLPFELKIADLTQDGAHAKCATKPLTGARYHDTATGWGLYLLFIYNANRQLPPEGLQDAPVLVLPERREQGMPFFHHRISGILRIFVPQISLISAGGSCLCSQGVALR